MFTGNSKIDKVVKLVQKVDFNSQKLKSHYRRKLESYSALCRMKFTPMAYKMFNNNVKEICKLYYNTISKEGIDRGNIIVVSCFLEHHFLFLNVLKIRVKDIKELKILKIAHDLILEKQKELLQCLYENIDNPVSLSDIDHMLNEYGEGDSKNATGRSEKTPNTGVTK